MQYGPQEGLHVSIMNIKAAIRHERRVYNIPDNCGMGWMPYIVTVRSHGGSLAHTAFHSTRELRQWMGRDYKLQLGAWKFRGFRGGRIIKT